MNRYLQDKAVDHTPVVIPIKVGDIQLDILRAKPHMLPVLMGWKEGDLITIDAGHGPVQVEFHKVGPNRTWWRGCSSHRLYNTLHKDFLEMWLKGRG